MAKQKSKHVSNIYPVGNVLNLTEPRPSKRAETYITFQEATDMLKAELRYPEEKALHFVKKFDKNKDGRLSASEFRAFKDKITQTKHSLVPKFQEYDRDGNGYITLAEASDILQKPPFSFPASKVIFLLRKFDKDGNGKLDIEEFVDFYAEAKATHADISSKFDDLDKDKNGFLSPDEVVCAITSCLGVDDKMAKYMVQMFDTNHDGKLDKQEFMTMWTSMFG